MDHPVDLLDGVAEAVDALTDRYRVMVITKGDLLHQETKVVRSGLDELLWQVEIVSEKDPATYRRILERHDIDPATFVMVGNSVRSDVLPVLEVGGRAVHIPYAVTWELEHAEVDPDHHDVPVLTSITELPELTARWDA
jgi:putative hydrolase of the HAD superfamily